ncbi:uncharacterized membrane protein YhaH (DUF805 family) [Weissella uvarum]|uniref:DUF805 domain-containing protein n=1 Tax=Weissella uvarum TaxID=1479233 RepID=UPI00195FF717|nr:DUF805 domain-containing protein [Weissella uvarum]MBM7617957.1 uncharacterized membrane protein YhaH (DUF805 family) [Weissella uvarum]MCM0596176.1 DUF805 domain-containing protein [Weissella uvarum]
MEAVIEFWQKMFDYTDRTRRKDFWLGSIVNAILVLFAASVVTFVLLMIALNIVEDENQSDLVITVVFIVIFGLGYVVYLLANLAAGVRRLRDAGLNPWWILLKFVPVVRLSVLVMHCFPSVYDDEYDWTEKDYSDDYFANEEARPSNFDYADKTFAQRIEPATDSDSINRSTVVSNENSKQAFPRTQTKSDDVPRVQEEEKQPVNIQVDETQTPEVTSESIDQQKFAMQDEFKVLMPIFNELELDQVSFDEFGREVLANYYYGLLSALADNEMINDGIKNSEFKARLVEVFDYSKEDAENLANKIIETTNNQVEYIYNHGYDQYENLEEDQMNAVLQDFKQLVVDLKATADNSTQDTDDNDKIDMSVEKLFVSNQETDSLAVPELNQNLLDEFIHNDWFSQYAHFDMFELQKLIEQWDMPDFKTLDTNERRAVMDAADGSWNALVDELDTDYLQRIGNALTIGMGTLTDEHPDLAEELIQRVVPEIAMICLTDAYFDLKEYPYYDELCSILLDGYLYTAWHGEYPHGRFGIYTN